MLGLLFTIIKERERSDQENANHVKIALVNKHNWATITSTSSCGVTRTSARLFSNSTRAGVFFTRKGLLPTLRGERGFFGRRQQRNFENTTLVARRRTHFRWFWAIFGLLTSLKKGNFECFNTQEFTRVRVLSIGVVSLLSHALWPVLSNKVTRVFGHCWVDTPPNIHTSECHSLFFQSCLLFTITCTPSGSDYLNRSASIQRVRLIHMTRRANIFRICTILPFVPQGACAPGNCCSKRQDKNAVSTRTGKSASSTQDIYCARGPGGGAKTLEWRENGRLKTSLAFVMFLLRAMTYIVSSGLLWHWIGVVRFVSHEVWSDQGIIIWHFLHCCFSQIVSLWSLSIWIWILFNLHELVY